MLGPPRGVRKKSVSQIFRNKKFFLVFLPFLTPLHSQIENFELTSSFAFFLKISELFSKPENSNYSRFGGRKPTRQSNIFELLFVFDAVFDPFVVKIRQF